MKATENTEKGFLLHLQTDERALKTHPLPTLPALRGLGALGGNNSAAINLHGQNKP